MAARRRGEDIIDLSMGNPDGPTPPHIVEKLCQVAQREDTHGYSTSRGIPRLRRAISRWYAERYQVEIDPESEAIVTIGSKEGLAHLMLATLDHGDTVLVPNPSYPIHIYGAVIAGAQVRSVPLVAGGGDNAAGAVGVGMTEPGQGMLSLGTSGVYFVVSDGYLSNPQRAVHSFCHALPQRWHLMSVILSAAACLDWAAALTGCADVPQLLAEAERADENGAPLWFLPYLSGERTPHNNPQATGVFFGLTHQHGRPELARAVLEGVGYALAQGMDAVHECGVAPSSIMLIGGGARSALWRQMLADISGQTLDYCQGGEVGPALGAARLAQLALEPQTTLPALTRVQRHQPDAARHQRYQPLRDTFARLYAQLAPLMR
ncbi:MAG TPA: hypothetical protein DCE46_07175 [Pantoea sp.]|nr:hypothetical protein [Pantoea sp.]